MRKLLISVFLIVVLTVFISSQTMAVPKMLLPETSFDFGFVPQDCKVSHVFWIKSVGDDSLKILSVKPGWGCTKAPLTKKEIAVGDSTELEIIYSTGKKVGPASKRPAISTNEGPPTKRVTISVHSVRQPDSTYPVVFKPYRVYVSRAGEVEVDEAKFTVTNVSDEDLELKIVSEPFGYLEIDLPDEVKAGESAECKIKVKEDHLNQSFEKSITLELNDPTKTRFSVPIIRRLIGAKKTQASKAGSH